MFGLPPHTSAKQHRVLDHHCLILIVFMMSAHLQFDSVLRASSYANEITYKRIEFALAGGFPASAVLAAGEQSTLTTVDLSKK
jgi:hypothetical protein